MKNKDEQKEKQEMVGVPIRRHIADHVFPDNEQRQKLFEIVGGNLHLINYQHETPGFDCILFPCIAERIETIMFYPKGGEIGYYQVSIIGQFADGEIICEYNTEEDALEVCGVIEKWVSGFQGDFKNKTAMYPEERDWLRQQIGDQNKRHKIMLENAGYIVDDDGSLVAFRKK